MANGGTLNFLALDISSILESLKLFGGPVVEEERTTLDPKAVTPTPKPSTPKPKAVTLGPGLSSPKSPKPKSQS